jgi:hypothetical protein
MSKGLESARDSGTMHKKEKASAKRTPPKRSKKELSPEELALRAWHKTYENRRRRSARQSYW